MAGIKRRLGSLLGPHGKNGTTPQFVEGQTTQVEPSAPAKVELVEVEAGRYRVDAQVPRGLDGDPNAVGDFGEALAVELNTSGSTGQVALELQSVRAIAQTMGAVFVYSETEPEETTMHGVPVVWVTPSYNTIPEVEITSAIPTMLDVELTFTGHDADEDPLVYTIDWGDGQVTQNSGSPATHTYTTGGSYTIQVTVTDGYAEASATTSIFVTAPLIDPYATDNFSHSDGTILAGWESDSVTKRPALLTETGDLLWEPGDSSTDLPSSNSPATVIDGRFGHDATSSMSATLNLPDSSARMVADYHLVGEQGTSRCSFFFACSPHTSRVEPSESSSVVVRVARDRSIRIYGQTDGSYTELARVLDSQIPLAGTLEASYDASTGQVTAWIDGREWISAIYEGVPYSKVGLEVRGLATFDNFQVAPL